MLDVYVCVSGCDEEFAVKIDKDPMCCPFCQGEVTYSHSTEE